MKLWYTLLFALSVVLINPWGNSRGEIWTQPKIAVVTIIAILNICLIFDASEAVKISKQWLINLVLWLVFLIIGLLATILSPFPEISLLGQEQMRDGWLYWLLIAIFTLSNSLIIKLYPDLWRSQLQGILFGSFLTALSIFPQIINWKIDYTATTGKLLKDNILVSTIFQNQQPIGFYSHRGHAAFVLCFVIVLAVFSQRQGWLNNIQALTFLVPTTIALALTQTRMAIIAGLLSVAYLLGRKYYKLLIPFALITLALVAFSTTNRQISNLPVIKQITSDRIYLWELASKGISQKPILGWGFNGFGIAYPYAINPQEKSPIIKLDDFSFSYQLTSTQIQTKTIPTFKAHNLCLDMILSVGFLGLLPYLTLIAYNFYGLMKSPIQGIEAGVIAYLLFTSTWFECSQFTHIFWWLLCLNESSGCSQNSAVASASPLSKSCCSTDIRG